MLSTSHSLSDVQSRCSHSAECRPRTDRVQESRYLAGSLPVHRWLASCRGAWPPFACDQHGSSSVCTVSPLLARWSTRSSSLDSSSEESSVSGTRPGTSTKSTSNTVDGDSGLQSSSVSPGISSGCAMLSARVVAVERWYHVCAGRVGVGTVCPLCGVALVVHVHWRRSGW